MTGVLVRKRNARNDFSRLLVRNPFQVLDHPFHIVKLKERLGRLNFRVLQVRITHLFALNSRTVTQHHVRDIGRGGRGEDRPSVTSSHQARQTANVVVVGVRDDHSVQ